MALNGKDFGDDFVPVTGGKELPASQVRAELRALGAKVAEGDLDKQIVRLLALHPELKARFPIEDLKVIDDGSKNKLLSEINEVLGIRPLQKASR